MSARAVLARREARQAEQAALVRETGAPLLSLTIVAPGPEKDGPAIRAAFAAGLRACRDLLAARGWAVRGRRATDAPTGPESLLAVAADPTELKAALVALEDAAPLGRLWDLDVVAGLDDAGLPVVLGRRALGLPPRRCLVCDSDAAACARSARHPLPVLLLARDALAAGVDVAAARAASGLAVRALVVEAELAPKPGLVDPVTNGAHVDMDLALLLRSADALRDWFTASWLTGATASGDDDLRARLVTLGLAAEAAMRRVTGGVNTHKGALFGVGLLLAALGAEGSREPERACARVGVLAAPLLADWLARVDTDASHGSAAFRELGLTGARGEAASGFATVRTVSLPAYRDRLAETGDVDDALRWALVSLMAVCPDTNLYARGGAEALAAVQGWAGRVVRKRPDPRRLATALAQADAPFTERRWSPGGSADLLALTWLLDRLGAARPAAETCAGEGP
nr:citrate lyase holo-[acyl-carrier protein] synthase [Propionibacterium sp.]